MEEKTWDNHVLYQSLGAFVGSHPPPWKKRLLNVGDTMLSLFVITPLVISHWRGTWGYMDLYPRIFPGWNCFILGAILHCCFAILREPLESKYHPNSGTNRKKSLTRSISLYCVKKIYTYLFSIGCIMMWRGGWQIMTDYYGNKQIVYACNEKLKWLQYVN